MYEPFRPSFLAVSPSEIVFTLALPDMKGCLWHSTAAFPQHSLLISFFQAKSCSLEKGRHQSIFLKSLFRYRTAPCLFTAQVSQRVRSAERALFARSLSMGCLQQHETGRRDEHGGPNQRFVPSRSGVHDPRPGFAGRPVALSAVPTSAQVVTRPAAPAWARAPPAAGGAGCRSTSCSLASPPKELNTAFVSLAAKPRSTRTAQESADVSTGCERSFRAFGTELRCSLGVQGGLVWSFFSALSSRTSL